MGFYCKYYTRETVLVVYLIFFTTLSGVLVFTCFQCPNNMIMVMIDGLSNAFLTRQDNAGMDNNINPN